jgi:hypothetical protein
LIPEYHNPPQPIFFIGAVRMTGSLEDGKKFVEFAQGGEYKFALDEGS